MRLKLNLLENSYDFLNESLKYVKISHNNKDAWKFAIINLVQSMELMFKESLRRIHDIFIYENIDRPKNTISISVALERLQSIAQISLSNREKITIKKAIEWRNQIMHYEVDLNFDEVESEFAIIFEFLYSFHKKNLNDELHLHILSNNWVIEANLFKVFQNEIVTYNTIEIHKDFVQEIIESQNLKHYIINGEKYDRIKYGYNDFNEEMIGEYFDLPCHDCAIIKGQYHVPGCDMETCPKCGEQAISCKCDIFE